MRQEYTRFSDAAGLRTQDERAQVAGFGHKEAARARKGAMAQEKMQQSFVVQYGSQAGKILENAHRMYPEGVTMSFQSGMLDEQDIRAINEYKSAKSYGINAALRNGENLSDEMRRSVHSIDQAILKLPKFEGTVYRSLSSEWIEDLEAFWARYVPGELVFEMQFTSASTEVYDAAMDIQMIIRSKSGRDMRVYNPLEKEILFRRGSAFFVEKIEGGTIWMTEL